jgi:carboxyl-terminal processing protease
VRSATVVLLGALLTGACGSGGRPPVAPSSGFVPDASRSVSDYVNELVGIMQSNSINRDRINWIDFRAQVTQRAQGARTIGDAHPAISMALGLLGDHHSFYTAAGGAFVSNPTGKRCSALPASAPALPGDVGYVRVGSFGGSDPSAMTAFADSVQQQIRSSDSGDLTGWIVDVRGNGGGNMWPMIAGVGPVLGDGVAGYFMPPLGAASPWSYGNGASILSSGLQAAASSGYRLLRPSPRVAVLTDNLVASSGEAVVVSFRARPNTRSFGTMTCGLSTANSGFRLSDGATLQLTTALMADRTRTPYGDSIPPDEIVSGDGEVVQRALAWLRSN